MNNSHLKGVVPIVITPLCPNGDIDQQSCKNVVNYLIDNGASALFILGSASEGFLLDIDQRIEVIRAMSEANNSRVPIIAGCSYMAPKMVFEFFRRVADRKSTRLNSSHNSESRMPSSA
jgi:4-hydroxy-tetrahydrodipicolinate synthase